MSDDLVGRYRRAYPRIWRHPSFKGLNTNQQRIALYILTGPQTNRIGLFHFSSATAAEDLGLGTDTLREGLRIVCVTFGWIFDSGARVCYIPSWWRWNRPDNVNVLRGNLKDLSEIPPCGLVDAFAANIEYVPFELQATFVETFRKRLGKRSPTQEQEQDQKQEQELPLATTGGDAYRSLPTTVSAEHQRIARECLALNSIRTPMDSLIDAFGNLARRDRIAYTNQDAVRALSAALTNARHA